MAHWMENHSLVTAIRGLTLAEIERVAILAAVTETGSPSQAAARLGCSVRKVQYKLNEYAAADDTVVVR